MSAAGTGAAPRRERLLLAAGAGAVLAVSAAARLVHAAGAFQLGRLLALDNDSLYHQRLMTRIAETGRVRSFDPLMSWPEGAHHPWAPAFDVMGAALMAAGGGPEAFAGQVLAASLPVLLGLAVVALAMHVATVLAPEGTLRVPAALAAGLAAALVPQGVLMSRFARTDHHVLEAVVLSALCAWAIHRLGESTRGAGFEVAGALLSAFAVLSFTGAPLYVALAVAPLCVASLRTPAGRLLGSGAPGLLAGAALAAAASAPIVAEHGRVMSFAYPSFLQPALVAVAGAGVALCVLAARATPRARVLAVAAAAGGIVVAVALAPAFASEVASGVRGWLLAKDPWIALIAEFQPAWHEASRGIRGALARWGFLGWGLAALAPFGVAAAARSSPPRAWAAAWFVLSGIVLSVWQIRFGRVVIPLVAAGGALGLVAVGARLLPRLPRAAAAGAPALVLLAAWADPFVRLAVLRPAPPDSATASALDLGKPGAEGAPGVFAPWEMGHQMLVVAGRPVVATGFGSYVDARGYDEVQRAWTLPEPELLAWMERRRLGFAVAGAITFLGGGAEPFRPGEGRLDLAWFRASPLSPLVLGGSGIPEAGVPHLERLMVRWASLTPVPGLSFPLPELWAYERVPGARIEGRAAPGARVVVEIDLVEWERPHVWKGWADAGPDGAYAVVVPLPTGMVRPTLATGAEARLRDGGAAAAIAIPEAAVRSGASIRLDLPDRAPSPPRAGAEPVLDSALRVPLDPGRRR